MSASSQPLLFRKRREANAPLIIYRPFPDSQLDFVDVLYLELQTEVEDSNKGAEIL